MKVLSLFDGISCGLVALQRAGIKVDTYYASEVDKYAIQVSQKNHPEVIQLGDVNNWREWDIGEVDLIIGGSPCQGFSIAGKQLAFDDPRSKLFFTMVDIINHYQPKYFLLENVKMKQEYENIITEYMGVQPIEINSALVSAQNRKRLYRTNIEGIEQPADKGIILNDVLEDATADRLKSYCLDANYYKGASRKQYKEKSRRQLVRIGETGKGGQGQRIYSTEGKSQTLSALGGGQGAKTDLYGIRREIPENYQGGHIDPYNRKELKGDKSTTLRLNSSNGNMRVGENYGGIRKLTPIECERLQTLPDDYTEGLSNTQRYKALGNGRTVDVIAHIFKRIPLD